MGTGETRTLGKAMDRALDRLQEGESVKCVEVREIGACLYCDISTTSSEGIKVLTFRKDPNRKPLKTNFEVTVEQRIYDAAYEVARRILHSEKLKS